MSIRWLTVVRGWPASVGTTLSFWRARARSRPASGSKLAMPTGVTVGNWAQAACSSTWPSAASSLPVRRPARSAGRRSGEAPPGGRSPAAWAPPACRRRRRWPAGRPAASPTAPGAGRTAPGPARSAGGRRARARDDHLVQSPSSKEVGATCSNSRCRRSTSRRLPSVEIDQRIQAAAVVGQLALGVVAGLNQARRPPAAAATAPGSRPVPTQTEFSRRVSMRRGGSRLSPLQGVHRLGRRRCAPQRGRCRARPGRRCRGREGGQVELLARSPRRARCRAALRDGRRGAAARTGLRPWAALPSARAARWPGPAGSAPGRSKTNSLKSR